MRTTNLKLAIALAATLLAGASARAGDLMDDLASMDLATINESAAEVEEFDLASLDFDGMAAEAARTAETSAEETDAIEACFRRIGFRRIGWGGGFGRWGGWGGGYCGGFRSFGYHYGCYRPLVTCRPIVSHCYAHCLPVVRSYWGCF